MKLLLICCNSTTSGLTDIYAYTPSGESKDISVKPQVQPCYKIHLALSKALSLCSACIDQDVVGKILSTKTRGCLS